MLKIFKLTEQELSKPPFGHAFQYLDSIVLELETRNIPIPKI